MSQSAHSVMEPTVQQETSPRDICDADRHIGLRIRSRRTALGLSQHQFAALIGVTYQQTHKYERGLNRVSAGRLFEIAEALQTPISWFFEGLNGTGSDSPVTHQRRSLELLRNFEAIDDEAHRAALGEMAQALAARSERDRQDSSAPAEHSKGSAAG